MKKTVISTLAIAAVLMGVSCKDQAKAEKDAVVEAGQEMVDGANEAASEVKDEAGKAADKMSESADKAMDEAGDKMDEAADVVAGAIPEFEDAATQEYVKAYDSYVSEYKEAIEKNDMLSLASLGKKGSELATKGQEVTKNLSAEDSKKLTDFLTSKSKELQEATANMKK